MESDHDYIITRRIAEEIASPTLSNLLSDYKKTKEEKENTEEKNIEAAPSYICSKECQCWTGLRSCLFALCNERCISNRKHVPQECKGAKKVKVADKRTLDFRRAGEHLSYLSELINSIFLTTGKGISCITNKLDIIQDQINGDEIFLHTFTMLFWYFQ